MTRKKKVSIAVETSCRAGGIALATGERILCVEAFEAGRRHAAQLVPRLCRTLQEHRLAPGDLDELYVSAGPGSFTGLRVGITVARTLAQTNRSLRCVAVPTPACVAENVRELAWRNLAVILDARKDLVHATLFRRRGRRIMQAAPSVVMAPAAFLREAPRPLLLVGEGLGYHDLAGEAVTTAFGDEPHRHLPTAEGLWLTGRRMARAGEFTEYHHLLPQYARLPEALRLRRGR